MRMRMRNAKPEDPHPHEENGRAFWGGGSMVWGFFRHVLAPLLEPQNDQNAKIAFCNYSRIGRFQHQKANYCPQGIQKSPLITRVHSFIYFGPFSSGEQFFSQYGMENVPSGTQNVPHACEEFLMRMRVRNGQT